jgi:predicted kinase
MRAVITVGISASGKTSYAKELVAQGYRDINRDWIRFNIVKPGANWSTYKFSKANEKEVTGIQGQMIMESCFKSENIVISDTNLNTSTRAGLIRHLEALGYEVSVEVFNITRELAIKRDNLRENGVGESVIYRQNLKMLDFLGRRTYIGDESKPKAIIFDVDGTIAEMGDRGPFDWARVGEDKPRKVIIQMLQNYAMSGYTIIVCSGRSDACCGETKEWLDEHVGGWFYKHLYMRQAGDFRKDNEVKEEIFWTNIANEYNVVAAVDDRPQMIRLWHELKIPNVIAVADPYIEF